MTYQTDLGAMVSKNLKNWILDNLCVNNLQVSFCQDQSTWQLELLPIEISKNDSDRVVDLVIFKNQFNLTEKVRLFLVRQNSKSVCRRWFIFYTSENVLIKHRQRCKN